MSRIDDRRPTSHPTSRPHTTQTSHTTTHAPSSTSSARGAPNTGCHATPRAPASTQMQQAARTRFAHDVRSTEGNPTHAATTTASPVATTRRGLARNETAAIEQGKAKLHDAGAAIDRARTDDEKRAASLQATKALHEVMQAAPSTAARRAILEGSASDVQKIGRSLDKLDKGATRTAVAHLSDAAELAGPGAVDALTKPLAQSLPKLLAGHEHNRGELLDGVQHAVQDGRGALLGASLARQSTGIDDKLARDLSARTADGIEHVRKSFDDANGKADARRAELGVVSAQWHGVLPPDAMQAGQKAFQREHGEFADVDRRAKALVSTLQAAGYAQDHAMAGALGTQSREALTRVDELGRTDVGAQAFGKALVQQGRGESTYLQAAGRIAGSDAKQAGAFLDTMQRSILATQGEAVARGDRKGLVDALHGAAGVMPDNAMREGFTSMERYAATAPRLMSVEAFAVGFAASARDAADGFSKHASAAEVGLSGSTSFRMLGAGFGVLSLGMNVNSLRDGATLREAAGTVVSAAGLSGTVAGLVMKEAAPQLLSKGAPVLSYALSTWDTVSAIRKGDAIGAVAAAAPLAGALTGAIIGGELGSVVPGAGTIIGGAVGSLIGVGISFGRRYLEDSPAEKLEHSTQSFLQGALESQGLSKAAAETASFRLRDVNDDFFGSAPNIAALAKQAGVPAPALMSRIARLPPDELGRFVKDALRVHDNGDDVRKAEERASKGEIRPDQVPTFSPSSDELRALWRRWAPALAS